MENLIRCKLLGNIYDSKGQNGNVFLSDGLCPTIISGITDNEKNGGIGSSNAPKILVREVWKKSISQMPYI